MWDQVKRFSRGRYPGRRILLLVTSGLLTFFVAAFAFTAPVHAEDAERSGSDLLFQRNTYKKASADELPPTVVAQSPDTQGYRYAEPQTNKVHFILVQGDATTATSGYYVVYDFNPPNNYTSNGVSAITVTINTTAANGDQVEEEQPEQVSACDGGGGMLDGVGYFICPMVNFIAKSMDKIYQVIAGYLAVTTVTADTNSPLYQLWKIIRDIANVCFVIAIIVIIYSQLTSIGISNYGIKHTLPRIIIAAILVNISYWICAIAVDASNILGYAIHSMFGGLMDKFSVGSNYTGLVPTWQEVAAVALAGTAGAAVAGWSLIGASIPGSLALLIPLLLSAVIAALVALLVLAARQALITIFIIISPLAFVAYILPNTEKYFTKWREAFMTLLLLFPIFSVVFSGAQLAGMAIIQSSAGNLFTIILGLGVQVAPIVITPLLVKFSGGIIGKVAGIVNDRNKGIVDRTRNWAQGVADDSRNKILSDQNRTSRLNNKVWNPNRWTKAINNRRRYVEGRRKAWEGAADATFAGTKYGHHIEEINKGSANTKQRAENKFADSTVGRRLELESRNLGVDKQEIENSMLRTQEGHKLTYRQQMAEIDKTRVQNEFEDSHEYGHKVDTEKRTVELEKTRIHNEHQANWDNSRRTDPGLLELDLKVKNSEIEASKAKEKLEKIQSDIIAQGAKSEHILNLRGVDAHTQAGMLNIAHDIKTSTIEVAAVQAAKSQAERVIAENKTKAMTENTMVIDGKTIVEYAGGIKGIAGQRAVAAKAKSEVSAALMEDIKNIGSTMEYPLSTNNNKLYEKIAHPDTSFAEKIAYTKAMSKNGGPGVAKLRQVLTELGSDGGGLIKPEELMDFKELLSEEGKIMSAGKDIEFFLTNSAHQDAAGNVITGPDGKPKYKTFNELSNDLNTWKNLSPMAFASQNATTQRFALEKLYNSGKTNRADYEAYMRIIDGIRTNPGALANVKQEVVRQFSIYSDDVLKSMRHQGLSPKVGEMK